MKFYMETHRLKRFAQYARRSLMEQVAGKLKLVLAPESAARRENKKAVEELEKEIKTTSEDRVVEKVAYTWFNRFCALRFMDVNRYTRINVISPLPGQFQTEILAEAKMGHIDEDIVPENIRKQVFAFLNGTAPSNDPQAEAYRLLIVAVCNYYNKSMPFLFEKIADFTELLMPDDLLSGNSILAYTREAMTPDACKDVEVIGWLYQFYISEKKDEVFDGLKKNKKITPENIPAATQLFTPHWIVRYLVENSLGRLWVLNKPSSSLIDKMEYYIKPEEPETDFLKLNKPEEIKICDPACGSGHMLVYAFDLLYAIYEEEGYEPATIPQKILTNNLFGIEIDSRAGELAAFALIMKALQYDKRFLRRAGKNAIVNPNICVLKNVKFDERELNEYMDFVGRDLFTANLETTLKQFEEADNFGSLIRPAVTDVKEVLKLLEEKDVAGNLFLGVTHQKVLVALKQADYLSPKYHVVVANPPYMGGKGMNGRLGKWVKEKYPAGKSDLFAVFIERILELVPQYGFTGLMTPFTWLFLSSYENLRKDILNQNTIITLIKPEYHSFFESAYVPICGFTLYRKAIPTYRGAFIDLKNFYGSEVQSKKALEAISNQQCEWFYRASTSDFNKVPGHSIAYWITENLRNLFVSEKPIGHYANSKQGLATADNERFLKLWQEVTFRKIGLNLTLDELKNTAIINWLPHQKGGSFRRWYGNNEWIINWKNNGYEIKKFGI